MVSNAISDEGLGIPADPAITAHTPAPPLQDGRTAAYAPRVSRTVLLLPHAA